MMDCYKYFVFFYITNVCQICLIRMIYISQYSLIIPLITSKLFNIVYVQLININIW